MYQSTAEFGNLVQQDSRTFKCLLTYDKVSITKVKSIKLTGGSEAEDDFSLGSTMSQYIEVTIPDGNLLIEGKEILLQIGMDVNGLTEYIPMGYFTVGKPKKADDQITFTAYDRMMNTERTFSMDGTTTNTVAALKKIADITGVPVVTTGLTAISMKVPKGYSCREVLSYVAQLHGAFAVCNRRGQIELHTYVDSDYKVKPNRYWGNFEHNDYNFNVSKFVCFTGQDKNGKSISISSGSGARSVSFSNPFMTQTALNNILTAFKDFSYMPGALKMMGDPRLDPWDVLTVEDLSGNTYNVPVMKLEWEYDGGLTYSVEAVGLSEEETNAIADGLIVNKMVSDNAAIAGSKLDIPSVISAINDSSQTIKSSRIWFDEQNQSLNQTYSQLNQNVTEIRSTASSAASKADAANETAGAASKTAQQALSVLSGISTLDAIGAALNNDAHVVHTNTDGSGGDYSDCFSKMTVYLGDTDVSDDSVFSVSTSAGVTGHWDDASRTYYVTAMSTDDGYVDIDALYGTGERYLTTRKGLKITTRVGKYILVQSGGAHIRKRFSISKAKDGKIGLSYDLHSSTLAVRKQKDEKTLIPASITFSATQNDNGLVRSYSGRYSIQETEDGTTYTLKYVSTSDEIQKIYTPSSVNVKAVRCTLLSAGGVSELDTQTVIIIADAEGLTDDIKKAQGTADQAKEAIVTTNQNVANIETSMEGFRTELSETTTDLHGLTDNTLLYNVKYHDNGDGTTTLNAAVYKNGTDVTKTYPVRWYTWNRKTESGEIYAVSFPAFYRTEPDGRGSAQ